MTEQTPDPADMAALTGAASYLRDQWAVLAADAPVPLPSAQELADGVAADKATAARVHAARPGVSLHHTFLVLRALRAVRALDHAPAVGRERRIPHDQLTADQLSGLYDDLDRYEEIVGELNETLVERAQQAARAEAERAKAQVAMDRVRVLAAAKAQTTAAGISDYSIGQHDMAVSVVTALGAPSASASTPDTAHRYCILCGGQVRPPHTCDPAGLRDVYGRLAGQAETSRVRADRLADTLRNVLDAFDVHFAKTTWTDAASTPAVQREHLAGWRAVLDQAQEQPDA
ncbi:hypothetical protein [Streptomyces sp. NPDC059597]|uniref:hypothetical protein n=1 Tax=Streptomyces sp. NPDC059597 TaxID=3346879 RepID=UPI0036B771DB